MKNRTNVLGSVVQATSYGPFSYLRSVIGGFIAGTAVFLIGGALNGGDPATNAAAAEMPILLICSLGGALTFTAAASIANYLIGSRILNDLKSRTF